MKVERTMRTHLSSEKSGLNTDKIAAYGWSVKAPGHFEQIHKTKLNVDDAYQRASTHAKVLRIAGEWSWVALGCLIIGRRDGVNYVVDGQHRLLAAMKRSDIDLLPCMVFETEDRAEEADGFLRANRNRKPMTTIQAFRAMVATGNTTAITAERIVLKSGRSIATHTSGSTFAAVGKLIELVDTNEAAARTVFGIAVDLCSDRAITNSILDGLFYLETRMENGSLADQPYRGRLMSAGYDDVTAGMTAAAAFFSKGGAKVWASGIQKVINYRARSSKLSIVP